MSTDKKLSERDRKFFALVARAAFANPFSAERAALDAEIGETSASDPHVLSRASTRLDARLAALTEQGLSWAHLAASDREVLFAALLFAVFHRYIDEIDRLIASPSRVRFARPLLSELAAGGVGESTAKRALELFYQMRRAHLAIGRRLIGGGTSMRRLREQLWNSVFTHDILRYERHLWNRMEDFSVLLLGETGTGKGEAARALGSSSYIPFDDKRMEFSARVEDSFVPVNLSEFAETLLESELFGHRRGAFTGAIENRTGALARVPPHGTLFIDEIGELSAATQVKLLRVLQERSFTPVGAHASERFHGRVVAATHRSLDELRSQGRLRDDFYYRVATQTIELPPLRVRLAENPHEARELVAAICERISGEASAPLAEHVHEVLAPALSGGHDFPGNVRELEQEVRRVLLTGAGHSAATRVDRRAPLSQRMERGELAADELVRAYCELLYARSKSYVQVAKVTGLDRRTVRRHLTSGE